MCNPIKASVYIITFNEEKNIGAALNRLIYFDEVVVVDSGSEDNTLSIAKTYPNVTVYHHDWPGFSAQKEYAKSLCKNNWVLNIDADELLSSEYIEMVRREVLSNEFSAIESRRTLLRWGVAPQHFGGEDRLIRLFRKSAGHYEPRRVHESISISGKIGKSDATIYHCENLSLSERVGKANLYSELRARDKVDSGNNSSLLKVILSFPLSFLQLYVFKGHFLSKTEGFITSMNAAFYTFMKYAKLWELEKHESRELSFLQFKNDILNSSLSEINLEPCQKPESKPLDSRTYS